MERKAVRQQILAENRRYKRLRQINYNVKELKKERDKLSKAKTKLAPPEIAESLNIVEWPNENENEFDLFTSGNAWS